MGHCRFCVGERLAINSRTYHLRRKLANDCWQLESDLDGELVVKAEAEMRELYNGKRLVFLVNVQDDEGLIEIVNSKIAKNFADFPEELRSMATRRLKFVLAYESSDPDNVKEKIAEVAAQVGDESPPSLGTVCRWAKAYRQQPGDLTRLVPNFCSCGNRKPRYSAEVTEIAMRELRSLHLSPQKISLQETLSAIRNVIDKENMRRPVNMKLSKPSHKFLSNLVGKIDAYEYMSARNGKAAANRHFRASLQSGEHIAEPLLRVEIDHTVLDLIVVHPESYLPLGRPTITIALDRCTRCILGYYVSFEPPSYIQVMKCLSHAIKPKDYVQTKYPEIQNPWPCWGIPQQIVVDNGLEFHSKDLEAAAFSLLIDLRFCPVAQPWWKGAVERAFRTVSKSLIHTIPGSTFSNIQDRGTYDSKKHAVVSLDVLEELLHTWICDVYHQTLHRSTLRTPASHWLELIEPAKQKLPASAEMLDVSLASIEKRTVFHYGIELNHLTYNSPDLQALRRRTGNIKVQIRWDRSDLGSIHVLDDTTHRYIKVPCTWHGYAAGISIWLHKAIRSEAEKKEGKESERKLDAAKARLRDICRNAMTGKRMATRKTAARAENGLETRADSAAVQPPVVNEAAASVTQPIGRDFDCAWDDAEDDDIPDFDVIDRSPL